MFSFEFHRSFKNTFFTEHLWRLLISLGLWKQIPFSLFSWSFLQYLYFIYFLRPVITLFSTGLYKSAFSTHSFGKLVYRISVIFVVSVCSLFRILVIQMFFFLILFSHCKNNLFKYKNRVIDSREVLSYSKKYFISSFITKFHL